MIPNRPDLPVDAEWIADLTQRLIRIPSPSFAEAPVAELLAREMQELGMAIRWIEVPHPFEPGVTSRQPVGTLAGSGGGASLMINGHMDPNVQMPGWTEDPFGGRREGDWIWGLGAQDDKGGLAAALGALRALQQAGIRLKGDVVFCPVAAHKVGGSGTRALLRAGVAADYCINLEHSANTLASVAVGLVRAKLVLRHTQLFFRYSAAARAAHLNAIEQAALVMARLGPSLTPLPADGWLRFTPHPDLPGFPMLRYDSIAKDHFGRECSLMMQVRTVPGQTAEGVEADLRAVIAALQAEHPALSVELTIPAGGAEDPFHVAPCALPPDHPLVQALSEGHQAATGQAPELGGAARIGNFGDGNITAAAGIASVQYGPGDIRIYEEWPTPDERVSVSDMAACAEAVAFAALRLCT